MDGGEVSGITGRERGDAEPIAKNVCAQLASGGHTSQANPIATSRSRDAFTKQLVHGWGRDEVRPGREMLNGPGHEAGCPAPRSISGFSRTDAAVPGSCHLVLPDRTVEASPWLCFGSQC